MSIQSLPPPQVQLNWIPLPVPDWFVAASRGRYMIKEGSGTEILRGAWIESGVMTKFMEAFIGVLQAQKVGAIPDFSGLDEVATGLAADAAITASVHPDHHFLAGLALRVYADAKRQSANDIEAVSTVYHAGMAHIREAMGMPPDQAVAVLNLLPSPPAAASAEGLAQFIRTVDGDHTMGAASLADAIVGWLSADPMARAELCGQPVPGAVWMKDGVSLVTDEDHWCRNRGARRMYLHADNSTVPEEVAAAVLAALINAEPVIGAGDAQVGVSLKLATNDAEMLRTAMLAVTEKAKC